VYENRVQRRTFGPDREKVMRGCRKLHNVELHNLYTSQNNIRIIKPRMMRGVQYIACMGEIIHAHKISVGKPEWKRPLGRPRHTWE
jgi:hypothetical protein